MSVFKFFHISFLFEERKLNNLRDKLSRNLQLKCNEIAQSSLIWDITPSPCIASVMRRH